MEVIFAAYGEQYFTFYGSRNYYSGAKQNETKVNTDKCRDISYCSRRQEFSKKISKSGRIIIYITFCSETIKFSNYLYQNNNNNSPIVTSRPNEPNVSANLTLAQITNVKKYFSYRLDAYFTKYRKIKTAGTTNLAGVEARCIA